jgi:hypothetical protein
MILPVLAVTVTESVRTDAGRFVPDVMTDGPDRAGDESM